MKETKVTVYTKNGCPKCDMTKNVLNGEGIEFKAINIQDDTDEGRAGYTYVVDELGLSEMPVVVAEGHEIFTGFKPDKLKALK